MRSSSAIQSFARASFPAGEEPEFPPSPVQTAPVADASSVRATGAYLCPHCQRDINTAPDETFDDLAHCIIANGRRAHIGPRRWGILAVLRRNEGQYVTNARIEEIVWADASEYPSVDCLRVHVHYLRRALQGTPYRITNAYYDGYKLECIA
jgi:DNA-binding response OmpR family regulator